MDSSKIRMIFKCLDTLLFTAQKLMWDSRMFHLLICRKNGQINIFPVSYLCSPRPNWHIHTESLLLLLSFSTGEDLYG